MSSSTLIETEYLPLHSSRFDDTLRLKPDLPVHTSRKAPHRSSPTKLRYTFLIRTGAFVVIELGFIILTFLAMINPIPLYTSPSTPWLTEAKSALTIISVIWHALAVFAIKDVILHIFSAEWMEQYRKSGSIIPGETDGVSRITSGIIDQIQHFISQRATWPFRLGFVSALLLLLLNGLGPSAITINSIPLEYPLKIKVANLTVRTSTPDWPQYSVIQDHANLITRLELLENVTYGFRVQQSNVLIPWPSTDLISHNGTIKYQSDVITYNFSCLWKEPTATDAPLKWIIDDQEWGASIPRGINLELDTGIFFDDHESILLPSYLKT